MAVSVLKSIVTFLIESGLFEKLFVLVLERLRQRFEEATKTIRDERSTADERRAAENDLERLDVLTLGLGQEIAQTTGFLRPDGLYEMKDGEISMPFGVFDWTTEAEPQNVKLELWNQIQRSLRNESEKTTGYYVDTPDSRYSYRVWGSTMTREQKREQPNAYGDCPSLLDTFSTKRFVGDDSA